MKTILIVEAVAAQRELLVAWLKDDYTVMSAADGETALALAAQVEPDLIFLALALPDVDGPAVMCQLQAQPRLREIPLIALTAQPLPEAEARARAAGCVGVLSSPLDADQVSGVLRSWLGSG